MAEAVLEHFPQALLAIGPPIEDGYYYDFDLGKNEDGKPITFAPEDLEKIEATMKQLLKKNAPLEHSAMSTAEAQAFFASQPYKLELIADLAEGRVDENGRPTPTPPAKMSIYRHRNFTDLCKGPHVPFTSKIKGNAIKLLRTGGAYWRGDENRPQLQRIYGTAWHNKEELDEYLKRLEEAKARDHRKLGKELELFHISQLVGSGLPLWLPKGAVLRETLENFLRRAQLDRGYQPVITPHIGKLDLYITSGHYPYYKESQYTPIDVDGEKFMLKPMNCPHHIEIYKSKAAQLSGFARALGRIWHGVSL
jgi:threonyl-tRNA synthetase